MGAASANNDHARSIRTIVPHEFGSVEEEDGDQRARKQQQRVEEEDEERSRRAELARPRTPESNRVDNHSVISQLFECFNTIINQFQLTVGLSSLLQVPHAVAQNTISTLEPQVTLLESFVGASQRQECPASLIVEPTTYPRLRQPILHLFLARTRRCSMVIVGGLLACYAS
jgi:hypothetical protein